MDKVFIHHSALLFPRGLIKKTFSFRRKPITRVQYQTETYSTHPPSAPTAPWIKWRQQDAMVENQSHNLPTRRKLQSELNAKIHHNWCPLGEPPFHLAVEDIASRCRYNNPFGNHTISIRNPTRRASLRLLCLPGRQERAQSSIPVNARDISAEMTADLISHP